MKKKFILQKRSGEKEAFDVEKLRYSLQRSGADKSVVEKTIAKVEAMLYDGVTSKDIYKKAFAILLKASRPAAARYDLKKAIMALGPTGFPFEKYIAALFQEYGYTTQTGLKIKGKCVQHEVDVIAENETEYLMMECKFHSQHNYVSNIKQALYVDARFKDIRKELDIRSTKPDKKFKGWLVTNTKLSSDAQQYGMCTGLGLMSWNFPKNESLRDRIDNTGLHPITAITTLSGKEKEQLLQQMIVLCRDLCKQPEALKAIGIKEKRVHRIVEEAKAICETKISISRGKL